MESIYVLEISADKLKDATDMLRYDSCYQVKAFSNGSLLQLYCVGYTPMRWASFGACPTLVRSEKVTAGRRTEKFLLSTGFCEGLRFVQHFTQTVLVEGTIVSDHYLPPLSS